MSENKFAVAVKAIVQHQDRFLLLKKSSSEDVNPNTYDLPGGRVEFGEELDQALKREVREETGLSIEIVKLINAWSTLIKKDLQLVGMTYWCQSKNSDVQISGEHISAEWLTLDELEVMNLPDWLKEEFALLRASLERTDENL